MMRRCLNINLTEQNYEIETIPSEIIDKYLGGRGLGAYLLYTRLSKGVDPLSAENALIFTVGPLQGTDTYYSSRTVLTTKSPLTNIYLYSVASGNLGHHIRKAGYVSIVITGRSPDPVYLRIQDGDVRFKSAKAIWGLNTRETQKAIQDDANLPEGSCACIGFSGEIRHKMAAVVTGGKGLRTFGRGGPGAVMGAKNLKGIIVSGSAKIEPADAERFKSLKKNIVENVKNNQKWAENWKRFGTKGGMPHLNKLGALPTCNWQTGVFQQVENITPSELGDLWVRQGTTCGPYCLNPCAHETRNSDGPWTKANVDGPEYETLYSFGPNCGVDRLDAVVEANRICDEYGIDTMSCGCTIAFAMECYEKGLIPKEELGGLQLQFGDAEAMVQTVELVAKREGFGERLSEGIRTFSQTIKGSEPFAMHCKGLEFGGYECRGMWGQALQFALSSRGACHHAYGLPARIPAEIEAGTEVKRKGTLVKNAACDRILFDCAVLCSFNKIAIGFDNKNLEGLINAVTGENYSLEHLMEIGLRVMTLERMFNVREGLRREDDLLPARLSEEPLPEGPNKGSRVPMDELLDEGYQALGWDKVTGIPLAETLEKLDLKDLTGVS